MRHSVIYIIISILSLFVPPHADAQSSDSTFQTTLSPGNDTLLWKHATAPSHPLLIEREDFDSIISAPTRTYAVLPIGFLGTPVFDTYHMLDSLTVGSEESAPLLAGNSLQWLNDLALSQRLVTGARQQFMINNPQLVRYNIDELPEPPKQYRAFVNPITTRIEFEDMNVKPKQLQADIAPKYWIGKFTASLQFSQAYVSPNWYQGGNNNLNMLGQFAYNLRLNQTYYPRYLFDMTAQYKIGINSTPDDSIRSYNINEDLFQFNLTAGLKAARKWFYSGNIYFKTQVFNSYPTNSREIRSAFLSPGELNVGLGMTYNHTNKKKTFSLALSISPISWNLKMCTNPDVDETLYGIKEGHSTANEIGSNIECNLKWDIAYNITYSSRLFAFTNYKYLQSDWEHTIDFAINRFLSTRLYMHLRYDTSTPRVEGSKWHKFQFKEILSIGFNYTFGTV